MRAIIVAILFSVLMSAQTVPARLSATATLTFLAMAQSECGELTIPLTGATPGDEVMVGAPADLAPGFLHAGRVSAADVVAVRVCKITSGSSITPTPSPGVWRATIVRAP